MSVRVDTLKDSKKTFLCSRNASLECLREDLANINFNHCVAMCTDHIGTIGFKQTRTVELNFEQERRPHVNEVWSSANTVRMESERSIGLDSALHTSSLAFLLNGMPKCQTQMNFSASEKEDPYSKPTDFPGELAKSTNIVRSSRVI